MLPSRYTLDIYGIEAEQDYAEEMKSLVRSLQLSHRVYFHHSIPAKDLPDIYVKHRFILNMASETIDKTMLEALTCGCYPITTSRNAQAIGIPAAPAEDDPRFIADFIERYVRSMPMSSTAMFDAVKEHHSLERLIEKMDHYISRGV